MKRNLLTASFVFLLACNSNQPVQTDASKPSTDSAMPGINSPYEIGYSSKFVMDNPKNAESILTLWKDWDSGNLSAHKDIFADTVEVHLANGSIMRASRDSIVATVQKFRNSLSASVDRVDAIMAVKSVDRNENWALIWGVEIDTDKKGKVDSTNLQETWRFNKDGRADLFFQFARAGTSPKK
jgi:hypothetical protein